MTPGLCPQRVNTRAATGRVKSKAGRRTIGLPPQLVALLQAHRAEQEQERRSAREIWPSEGWVFATPDGQPLNPNSDYYEWKRLLKEAGLREARLHDARHTAATVLQGCGVASDASFPGRREDGAVRAAGLRLAS
jgi:integrase